jgi:hypothetical protein
MTSGDFPKNAHKKADLTFIQSGIGPQQHHAPIALFPVG